MSTKERNSLIKKLTNYKETLVKAVSLWESLPEDVKWGDYQINCNNQISEVQFHIDGLIWDIRQGDFE